MCSHNTQEKYKEQLQYQLHAVKKVFFNFSLYSEATIKHNTKTEKVPKSNSEKNASVKKERERAKK